MLINTKELAGVRMGKGFKDALFAPSPVKEYITNESRLEHGVRVLDIPIRKDRRSLTLEFQIWGASPNDLLLKKNAFYAELARGQFDLAIPELTTEVFHLHYTGKSTSYSSGLSNCACKVKCGFEEFNPNNRS